MASRFTRQTGWSYMGAAPPRIRSMTYTVKAGTERSTLNAISAQHGILATKTWTQRQQPLVIPMPVQF